MRLSVQININDASEEEIREYFNRGGSSALAALVHSTSTVMPTNHTADIAAKLAAMGNGMAMPVHHQVMAAPDDDNGPANPNAPAIDTAGMPWDERIHSKNKNTNADGTWRAKRGVDGAIKAAVETELKMRSVQMQPPAQFTAPSSTVMMPPQPQFQQPPAPQYMPPPQFQPGQMQQPPAPQYMQPPAQQPQFQQQPAQMDFTTFMQQLSVQMGKQDQNGQPLIHTDYLAGLCQRLSAQFGRPFNSITDIATDPNAINTAVAFISADGRWN